MLLSLQNLLHRLPLEGFKRLIVISATVHGVVIVMLLMVRMGHETRVMISPDYDDATIVVMPLYKTLGATTAFPAGAEKRSVKKQVQTGTQSPHAARAPRREYHSASAYVRKKSAPTQSPVSAQEAQDGGLLEYTSSPRKQRARQADPAPSVYTRKKRLDYAQSSLVQREVARSVTRDDLFSAQNTQELPASGQDGIIYLGREEAAEVTKQRAIRHAVMQEWRTPAGLTVATPCELAVDIETSGVIKKIRVVTSSGMPAFDAAARAAVMRTLFPASTWGSTLMLVFG